MAVASALLLLFAPTAGQTAEEQHGGCDVATGDGLRPSSLFATPVTLTAQNFGSASPGPLPSGATARGCAQLLTCGQCAAVAGCGWCANAWSQSCVDTDSPAASCACAGSVVTSPSTCSHASATAQQVDRVDGRPTCDASSAGVVVADLSADGEFFGCLGATTEWVSLGGGGSAVLSPPVVTAVATVALPFNDDLGSALTLLDPAPLSVFQGASDIVDVELTAAGCLVSSAATAGVALSVPEGMQAGESAIHLRGLMSAVNVAMQTVRVGCYCIGAAGVSTISATVTGAGATATASIPVAVGAVSHVTTISGSVVDHITGVAIEGAQVQLTYEGGLGSANDNCAMSAAVTDADGVYSIECPTEYLGGGSGSGISHHVQLDAWKSESGESMIRTGFAATEAVTLAGPELRLTPGSASTGAVSGLCLSAPTLEPLGGATVSLQRIVAPDVGDAGASSVPQTTVSDVQGAFGIAEVQEGAYRLIVQRPFAVTLEQSVLVTSGETVSLLAPLSQERAGGTHWRAVLQWRGSGDLDARIEATGCIAGTVEVTASSAAGCDDEHPIRHEANSPADAGFGGAESLLVASTTASGTYSFSVSAASTSSWSEAGQASVRVYSAGMLLSELYLPGAVPGDGDIWNVFCWDSAAGVLHVLGSLDGEALTCTDGCACV